ncbi:MAG: hypothetical protein ACF8XB_14115 [Planctomycetota bacterium JB042]
MNPVAVEEVCYAWVQVAWMLVSLVVSAVTASLLAPDAEQKQPLRDENPTTLTTRGSMIPLLKGRRLVGPIFAWAGERHTVSEAAGGGGGGKGGGEAPTPEIEVFYESGWHILCVGPAYKLNSIRDNGKKIFDGPITAKTHPSGSTIDLENGEEFDIYWGENDQPVSSFLSDKLGIASRWPHHCYVLWRKKRLGTQPTWGNLQYDIETRPFSSEISTSPGWIKSTLIDTGDPIPVVSVTDGNPGAGEIVVEGNLKKLLKHGAYFRLEGNAAEEEVFESLSRSYDKDADETTVIPYEPIEGSDDNGNIQLLKKKKVGGVNAAHGLYELLFDTYPHGIRLPKEIFSITSMNLLGERVVQEGLPLSLFAKDGMTAQALISALLQDLGCMIPLERGLYRFRLIRAPESSGEVVALSNEAIAPPRPEVITDHDIRPDDRLQFTFADAARRFRDFPAVRRSDSQALLQGTPRLRKVPMPTVIELSVAEKVATRREQEEVSNASAIQLNVKHEGRRIAPGRMISFPDSPIIHLVTAVQKETDSSVAKLTAVANYYGVTAADIEDDEDVEESEEEVDEDPEPFEAFTVLEVPTFVSKGKNRIVVPRLRHDALVGAAQIWISADDTSYKLAGKDFHLQAGGRLTEPLDLDGFTIIEEGPTFDAVGPDIAQVLDLTGNDAAWLAGEQVAVINGEVFFLRNITAMGGSSWRLDGLIRARFDTVRGEHAVDDFVFIFPLNSLLAIDDVLIGPGKTIFVKCQAVGSSPELLSDLNPVEVELAGKGVAPMRVPGLRTQRAAGQDNSYLTGQDIEAEWGYRSSEVVPSGAGYFPPGSPFTALPVEGTFTLRVLSSGDVEQRVVSGLTSPAYTYTNANLVSDFGGEPSSFKLEITQHHGGYSSPPSTITVTKR